MPTLRSGVYFRAARFSSDRWKPHCKGAGGGEEQAIPGSHSPSRAFAAAAEALSQPHPASQSALRSTMDAPADATPERAHLGALAHLTCLPGRVHGLLLPCFTFFLNTGFEFLKNSRS